METPLAIFSFNSIWPPRGPRSLIAASCAAPRCHVQFLPFQELRSLEATLEDQKMEQRLAEERLRQREAELKEREMNLLQRELHMMIQEQQQQQQQLQQQQQVPTPKKRMGKFRSSKLKLLMNKGSSSSGTGVGQEQQISAPSGTNAGKETYCNIVLLGSP